MIRKVLVLVASAAIATVAITGCGPAAPAGSEQTLKASFGVDSFNLGAPVFVAQDKGYFAEEKVEVSTTTFQTGVEGVQAVLAGQLDFGFAFDFATVSSVSPKLVVLGAVDSPAEGFHQMFFGKGITQPAQLVGGKIGVLPGTAQEYLTQKWIEKNGLKGSVETVGLPGMFESVSALKTGQIQATFLFADGVTQAKTDSSLTQYGDDSGLLAAQGIYLMTLRNTVEKKPELVDHVLRALKKSTELMAQDPGATADITAKAVQGDAAAIKSSLERNKPALQMSAGQVANLRELQSFLITAGKIPADTNVGNSLYLDPMRSVVGDAVVTP